MAKTSEARIVEDPQPQKTQVVRRGHTKVTLFQCRGQCGVDEICREQTWLEGYCLDPTMRWLSVGGKK